MLSWRFTNTFWRTSLDEVFIVGEIGINHNGDLKIAKELIDISSEAGADAVKFQKRTVDKVYSKETLEGFRESPWGHSKATKRGIRIWFI